ncbi:unnamed protein product [Durusdinium trenchii]|uniref:Tyrosine-protein kinase ephrin type A/B receptor-like domain-containing protein n=1 Tax=Durusdinium trenchii TaxID=1381693 RepID=A0ABP0K6R1_9DINO
MRVVSWIVLSWLQLLPAEDGLEEEAVPWSRRRNVTLDGVSMPLGIVIGNWGSAKLVSNVYRIIVSEVLGLHVDQTYISSSREQILELVGCDGDPAVDSTTQCGLNTRWHVTVENWLENLPSSGLQTHLGSWLDSLAELGSQTYVGKEGMYLLAAHGRGLEQGLALEYYRSYNRSWHQPELYLPLVRDVNHSRLDFCNNSFTRYPDAVKTYLSITNDLEGTEQVGDQVHWKCYKDSWWVAPACRTDPEECIAIISKRGWGIIYFPQKAFFFGMGVALTNGLQVHVDEWIHLNHELQGLLYWWSPDSSFIRDPHFHVQFPPHSPAEYRAGTYRTMQKESSLSKFALSKIETEALEVLRQLELDTEEMNDLLEQHANCEEEPSCVQPLENVTCEWLRSHRERWMAWLPKLKICAAGTGVQFENGSWMDCAISRAHHCGEARCVLCAPGTWSESWEGTFVCKACPAGKVNQFHGQTECVPCEAGHFAAKEGLTECKACDLGYYANSTGMSECFACSDDPNQTNFFTTRKEVEQGANNSKRIQFQGAPSEDFCSCREGYHLSEMNRCEKCSEGASCTGRGEVTVAPGFWSSQSEPNSVFRCYGNPHACPGGRPGTCASGRFHIRCGRCLQGTRQVGFDHPDSGACMECSGGDYALLLVPILALVLCAVIAYAMVNVKCSSDEPRSLVVASVCMSGLMSTVASLIADNLTFPLTALHLDSLFFSFQCASNHNPVQVFILSGYRLTFGLALLIPLVHGLWCAWRGLNFFTCHMLTNVVGNCMLAFSTNQMHNLLTPFVCKHHPNRLYTVSGYTEILCDGNEAHMQMVVFGLLGMPLPLGFVALCLWLLFSELPKRMLRGDIRFVRRCHFLVGNFRPGAEVSVAIFIARGALSCFVDLVPTVAGKVLCMNLLLLVSLLLTAIGKPWRSSLCNALDLTLLVGVLNVLDLGSYLIPELDVQTMANICMVTATLMVMATLSTVIGCIIRYAILQTRKQYRFYISSYTAATGSYARMLKMEFEHSGLRAFLDADAAKMPSLQERLSILSNCTETVIFLGTREAFCQMTCIGEMVTAHVHDLHSVLLTFPSFVEPWEIFHDLQKIIPDIMDLVSLRIGLQEIQDAFRWVVGLESFAISSTMTKQCLPQVVAFLEGHKEKCRLDLDKADKPHADCLILADLDNLEAAATAMILQGFIAPLLQGWTCEVVEVLMDTSVPADVIFVLLVCSDGCFETPRFAHWLLQLRSSNNAQVFMLPIIAEPGFRFPSLTFHMELLKLPSLETFDLASYAQIIRALFCELWFFVAFCPQSSGKKELYLRSEQAHALLQAARPLAERLAAVEAEVEVQDQDEDTRQAVAEMSREGTVTSVTSQTLPTIPSNPNLEYMAEIYQMYFNPTVHESF